MAAAVLLSVPEARGLFSAYDFLPRRVFPLENCLCVVMCAISVLMESEPFALPLRDTKSMPVCTRRMRMRALTVNFGRVLRLRLPSTWAAPWLMLLVFAQRARRSFSIRMLRRPLTWALSQGQHQLLT